MGRRGADYAAVRKVRKVLSDYEEKAYLKIKSCSCSEKTAILTKSKFKVVLGLKACFYQ